MHAYEFVVAATAVGVVVAAAGAFAAVCAGVVASETLRERGTSVLYITKGDAPTRPCCTEPALVAVAAVSSVPPPTNCACGGAAGANEAKGDTEVAALLKSAAAGLSGRTARPVPRRRPPPPTATAVSSAGVLPPDSCTVGKAACDPTRKGEGTRTPLAAAAVAPKGLATPMKVAGIGVELTVFGVGGIVVVSTVRRDGATTVEPPRCRRPRVMPKAAARASADAPPAQSRNSARAEACAERVGAAPFVFLAAAGEEGEEGGTAEKASISQSPLVVGVPAAVEEKAEEAAPQLPPPMSALRRMASAALRP